MSRNTEDIPTLKEYAAKRYKSMKDFWEVDPLKVYRADNEHYTLTVQLYEPMCCFCWKAWQDEDDKLVRSGYITLNLQSVPVEEDEYCEYCMSDNSADLTKLTKRFVYTPDDYNQIREEYERLYGKITANEVDGQLILSFKGSTIHVDSRRRNEVVRQ